MFFIFIVCLSVLSVHRPLCLSWPTVQICQDSQRNLPINLNSSYHSPPTQLSLAGTSSVTFRTSRETQKLTERTAGIIAQRSMGSTAKSLNPRPVVSSQHSCARSAFADRVRCVLNKKIRPTSKGRPDAEDRIRANERTQLRLMIAAETTHRAHRKRQQQQSPRNVRGGFGNGHRSLKIKHQIALCGRNTDIIN
jgi:hypothetical protein